MGPARFFFSLSIAYFHMLKPYFKTFPPHNSEMRNNLAKYKTTKYEDDFFYNYDFHLILYFFKYLDVLFDQEDNINGI